MPTFDQHALFAVNWNHSHHVQFESWLIALCLLSIMINHAMFTFNPLPYVGPIGHVCFQSSVFTHITNLVKPYEVLFAFIHSWSRLIKANNVLFTFNSFCWGPVWFHLPPIWSLFKFYHAHFGPVRIQSTSFGCSLILINSICDCQQEKQEESLK